MPAFNAKKKENPALFENKAGFSGKFGIVSTPHRRGS
jgi:hypothetical protein